MMARTIVAAAALLLAASCNQLGGNQYPPEAHTNFVNACTSGGAGAAICECGFRNIQKEFTFQQFTEMDRAAATGQQHASMPRVGQIMQACVANPNM